MSGLSLGSSIPREIGELPNLGESMSLPWRVEEGKTPLAKGVVYT